MSVAHGICEDLPGYDAPTFTLIPVGSTSQRSVQVSGFDDIGRLAPLCRLVSASYSSGQRFAFGFLQIRSYPRHPCRSANSSPCRASKGLSPPSECALPGAPKKTRLRGVALNPHQRRRVEETRVETGIESCLLFDRFVGFIMNQAKRDSKPDCALHNTTKNHHIEQIY